MEGNECGGYVPERSRAKINRTIEVSRSCALRCTFFANETLLETLLGTNVRSLNVRLEESHSVAAQFPTKTAGVPRAWATHGGEDVPVFAIGPLASVLFSGSVDQSYIPHAISYASCLGHYASRCSRDSSSSNDTMSAPISCPSAEPNSAAISSDVMNDQARNPPTKSAASLEPVGSQNPGYRLNGWLMYDERGCLLSGCCALVNEINPGACYFLRHSVARNVYRTRFEILIGILYFIEFGSGTLQEHRVYELWFSNSIPAYISAVFKGNIIREHNAFQTERYKGRNEASKEEKFRYTPAWLCLDDNDEKRKRASWFEVEEKVVEGEAEKRGFKFFVTHSHIRVHKHNHTQPQQYFKSQICATKTNIPSPGLLYNNFKGQSTGDNYLVLGPQEKISKISGFPPCSPITDYSVFKKQSDRKVASDVNKEDQRLRK
ncbi:Alkaline phosphatase, tissue-nonspecific isozyme [Melipona quadrifasciata]|uniref:alkaline phosphatase n=1 Tax=Melipona quadrifasciata TaxID=166423 RepID=A0A0N0U506_9HYME|nr:Alkaline phosphatase, tissue-nonspecific isozyme [Melipona quadrifasciata]